jgi:hypothetical protein
MHNTTKNKVHIVYFFKLVICPVVRVFPLPRKSEILLWKIIGALIQFVARNWSYAMETRDVNTHLCGNQILFLDLFFFFKLIVRSLNQQTSCSIIEQNFRFPWHKMKFTINWLFCPYWSNQHRSWTVLHSHFSYWWTVILSNWKNGDKTCTIQQKTRIPSKGSDGQQSHPMVFNTWKPTPWSDLRVAHETTVYTTWYLFVKLN